MNFRLGIGIWYRYRYEFWVSVSGIGIGVNFGYRYLVSVSVWIFSRVSVSVSGYRWNTRRALLSIGRPSFGPLEVVGHPKLYCNICTNLEGKGGGQKLLTRRIPNYHFHCTLLSSSPACFSVFKFAAFVYICAHNIVYVTNILVMLDDLKKVCFM